MASSKTRASATEAQTAASPVAAPAPKKAAKKTASKKKASKKKASKAKKKTAKAKATKKTASKKAGGGAESAAEATPKRRSARALVVVESPAKAKTVKKYLGAGYVVKASVGHVKDLPKSRIAVDIEHDFAPQYETIRGKSKVLKEIKDAAKEADLILLAPDPDREGEAIAWHIADELGAKDRARTYRILFHEITKRAVQEAVDAPRALDRLKFESQQARRVLDRLVGYQISPILWDKVRRGLSAGRVQSVAVRLVVEREAAVRAFVAEEYWSVQASLRRAGHDGAFFAQVVRKGDDKFRPQNEQEAEAARAAIDGHTLKVDGLKQSERRRKPSAPLITSKLQQEAAGRLRYTAKRTMMLAQQLYEGIELGEEGSVGLITYMRTDSPRLSKDAIADVRAHIEQRYGKDHLPDAPIEYKSKKSAQEAHEAIRPTSMAYPPERVQPYLTPEQFKLYSLVWRTFVACQMQPAIYEQSSATFRQGEYELRASGSRLLFAGFLAAFEGAEANAEAAERDGEGEGDGHNKDATLPPLAEGSTVEVAEVLPKQHFTQPPPRFSESSLVRELEEKGIGRPSTYATILSTIVTRGYVEKVEGRFFPSELGLLVTDLLLASFPKVLDVAFTAAIEAQLDEVETGEVDWVKLLGDFWFGGVQASLERAKIEMRDVKREEIPTDHKCDKCGKTMMQKWGRNGSFLACEGYPECRNTRDYKRTTDGTLELLPEPKTDLRCPSCDGPMVVKRGRFGQFLACETYPECKGTRPISIGVDCPARCGSYLSERRSKRGRTFYGCAGYPNCTFVSWDRPIAGSCPLCKAPYLLRKYSKKDGVTIRCSDKTCGYTRDPELDDEDARAVSGG
jgi:DNA topoisomerase-1